MISFKSSSIRYACHFDSADGFNLAFFSTFHTISNFGRSNSSKMVNSFLFRKHNTWISSKDYSLLISFSTHVLVCLLSLVHLQVTLRSSRSGTKNSFCRFCDFCIWNIRNKGQSLKLFYIWNIKFLPNYNSSSFRLVFVLLLYGCHEVCFDSNLDK